MSGDDPKIDVTKELPRKTLINNLSDQDLLTEYDIWNQRVREAFRWGSVLAAAAEFRQECRTEILRRNLSIPKG